MTRKDILQTLSKFQQDRRDEFGIVRLGVFGSTARDQFGDESDVDVVVELAHPDLFALIGIKHGLIHAAVTRQQAAGDAARLTAALGLHDEAGVRGALDGETDAAAMSTLLWPATWGYYLEQFMGPQVTPRRSGPPSSRHGRWVPGRGPLPALRAGSLPYGVLPCSPWQAWCRTPDDPDATFEAALVDVLRRLSPFWRDATGRVARAGRGDPEQTLVAAAGPAAVVGLVRCAHPAGATDLVEPAAPGSGGARRRQQWDRHRAAGAQAVADAGFPGAAPPLAGMVFAGQPVHVARAARAVSAAVRGRSRSPSTT